ncbi:hypothetical protein CpipJ_CPIJ012058 [Culex quinquefasciatus]|uniref:Uncharacterized protein n=1 Tax=Culex quinquefasciatus TaxID=7176 RepID=B0WYG5_CULQU|nr:hypothetical protein CpipJ_CPIJ012058 [Culex quinquefasciatus]|eukprot:XP_001862437.1 hypothetical protein CpipJ_CPIJ012058 [Culex quinquefasciatus]
MKSGRLTIAWYRNRPSPTTPGWLRSWARNILIMLGYKSDGRVEVVVNMVHKALVAILRVANGLDYSEILGEEIATIWSSTLSRQRRPDRKVSSVFSANGIFYD